MGKGDIGKGSGLVEFAPTPGGQLAYSRDLFAVPVAVTVKAGVAVAKGEPDIFPVV